MLRTNVFFSLNKEMINTIGIIERFYEKNTPLYNLLIKHSTQVAKLAQRLALRLLEEKHQPVDVEFVSEAAMLHDIGIIATNAPGIYCNGTEPYIRHGIIHRMQNSADLPFQLQAEALLYPGKQLFILHL